MQNIKETLKGEIVLLIATILAIISSVIVGVDKKYVDYIDFRTLGILFCLMVVVAGFKSIGVFDKMAAALLKKANDTRRLFFVLVLLCFLSSMIITNDVALITFVPLSLIIFKGQRKEMRKKWVIPLVCLETVAANFGSMLTPIGNPQNLYLYTKSNMNLGKFVFTMLPYSVVACVVILISIIVITRKKEIIKIENKEYNQSLKVLDAANIKLFVIYGLLFVGALSVVLRIINYIIVLIITVVATLLFDRKILKKVDYSLLLTFIAFFIFVGNMERIEFLNDFFANVVVGRERGTAIALSQIISNVPAAFLLSGFTGNYKALMVGVNIGGLGTLIASMSSLISYKFLAKEEPEFKGRYFVYFTVVNIIFLVVMIMYEITK